MCGRASITLGEKELETAFGSTFYSDDVVKYNPLFNIAPTHFLPVITSVAPSVIRMAHWGFRREWKDFKTGEVKKSLHFNARYETMHQLKTFAPSFEKGQRCVFLFDGFYEWMQTRSAGKVPFRIGLKTREPFAVAGLWEESNMGGAMLSATIITCEPNEMMRLVHNKPGRERMPAILHKDEWHTWVNPATNADGAISLIKTFPADEMYCHPVTNDLNREYENEPKFVQPVFYDMEENELLKQWTMDN